MDVLEIESIFKQEQQISLNINTFTNQYPADWNVKLQKLKAEFLLLHQQSAFLKQITSFEVAPLNKTMPEIADLKTQVADLEHQFLLTTQVIIDHSAVLESSKGKLIDIVVRAREVEDEYNQSLALELKQDDVIQMIEDKEADDTKIAQLQQELSMKKSVLERKEGDFIGLQSHFNELETRKMETEKREIEAIKLSNQQDPKIKELSTWFEVSRDLLFNINEIKSMSINEFDVLIDYYQYSVLYSLNSTRSTVSKITVDGIEVFDDLLQPKSQSQPQTKGKTLEEQLYDLIPKVKQRMDIIKQRELEFDILIENGGIYDPETSQLLIPIESRVFVFKIDFMYPHGGFKIIGIEPRFEGEIGVWNEKIKHFTRLSDVVKILE